MAAGRVGVLGAFLIFAAACSDEGGRGPASRPAPREIRVAAAANLQSVWPALIDAFQAARPDVAPRPVFGATGALVEQALNGAPFDVLLAADAETPQKLVAAGVVDAAGVAPYAVGKLALWTRSDSKLSLEGRGLEALRDAAAQKIAIARPAVAPFGRAAERALKAAGVYDDVRGKIVFGENVAQAAQFADVGAATVAFLSLAQAASAPLKDRGRWIEIPLAAANAPVQCAALLKRSRDGDAAAAFFDFVRGPAGRAVFVRAGYAAPTGF
jgi:molybdate transport system substrate-binding protein